MPWIFITRERYRELTERVDKLEKDMKAIDLDWSSVYDKFRSIVARMAKRAEREAATQSGSPEAAESQEASIAVSDASFPHSGLNSHQREMQQKILRRRAGLPS